MTSIESVSALSRHEARLKALGYHSLEQFVGAAHASGEALSRYLGVDVDSLLESLPPEHAALVATTADYVAQGRKFPLGAARRRIPRRRAAFAVAPAAAAALPPRINMVAQMPPIRDQGQRGSCVAFSSLAVVEHYAGLNGAYVDMSEQFLYYDCKANDGDPDSEGTVLSWSFPLLQRDGCCLEATWPYNPNLIPGNEGQGPASGAALAEAANYRIATINPLSATSVQILKNELARSRCVAFIIPVFNSWYLNNEVTRTGDIILPIPNEQSTDEGHSMCLVGYVDDNTNPALGGGSFILRNSWDSQWGLQSPYGVGYGTIPYAYMAAYAEEAYSIY
jgi:C1A family cysteine protease